MHTSQMRITDSEKVVILRMRRGWSQNRLAQFAHLSRATISMIERGKAHPEKETWKSIWRTLRAK
jgi:DNA-binding XRE family transcriptional regulator